MSVLSNLTLASAAGVFIFGSVAGSQAEMISRCVIEIDNAVFLDGPCNYLAEEDGSFTIGAGGDGIEASRYFAYVFIDEESVSAYWNGFPPASRAHTPIENLVRKGACLVGREARICAYK